MDWIYFGTPSRFHSLFFSLVFVRARPQTPINPLSPHNPTFRRPGGRSKISATKVKSCCAVMVGSTSSSLTSPETRRTCSFIQLLRLPAWLWCHRPTKAVSKGLWYTAKAFINIIVYLFKYLVLLKFAHYILLKIFKINTVLKMNLDVFSSEPTPCCCCFLRLIFERENMKHPNQL